MATNDYAGDRYAATPPGMVLAITGYAVPSSTAKTLPITIVLIALQRGAYIAYRGHGEPLWVQEAGDRLAFAEAVQYFPDIEKERYRG